MKDALVSQRRFFENQLYRLEKLDELSQLVKGNTPFMDFIFHEIAKEAIYSQMTAEFAYRYALFKGKILGLGLKKYESKITNGIKNGIKSRFFALEYPNICDWTVEDFQQNTRANTDCAIQYGLDYIDRWAMYNNLFKGKNSSIDKS